MRGISGHLVPAALLACVACQPQPTPPVIYGPWEEGLTLTYEDPSQPEPRRSEDRLQVRVARSTLGPGTPSLIQLDLTKISGRVSVILSPHDGGIDLVEENGRVLAQTLPAHFPDIAGWVEHGTEYRVIGRAAWEGASILPSTSDPIGVWVEARSLQGFHRRTLYLPGLGEVESREERGGTWVVVNRLLARGFTDLPSIKRPH
jgi:hypothetical protein